MNPNRNLEEDEFGCYTTSPRNDKFDLIIGEIEDIVIEDAFQDIHTNFLENNYRIFEDTEENKLEYFDIFKKYTNIIEDFLIKEIQRRVPDFDIEEFTEELESQKQLLDGEIFELLLSFSDFMKFKELILDYKAEKNGKYDHLDLSLCVKRVKFAETEGV